jgi:dihydrofolate reductase
MRLIGSIVVNNGGFIDFDDYPWKHICGVDVLIPQIQKSFLIVGRKTFDSAKFVFNPDRTIVLTSCPKTVDKEFLTATSVENVFDVLNKFKVGNCFVTGGLGTLSSFSGHLQELWVTHINDFSNGTHKFEMTEDWFLVSSLTIFQGTFEIWYRRKNALYNEVRKLF